MATLHVHNVPDDFYEELRRRATEHRRSLSAEAVQLLEQALLRSQRAPAEILDTVRQRRYFEPAAVGAPDSTTLVRETREQP
jgi:plasmid stability protein